MSSCDRCRSPRFRSRADVRAGRRVPLLEGSIFDPEGTELVCARALRVRRAPTAPAPSRLASVSARRGRSRSRPRLLRVGRGGPCFLATPWSSVSSRARSTSSARRPRGSASGLDRLRRSGLRPSSASPRRPISPTASGRALLGGFRVHQSGSDPVRRARADRRMDPPRRAHADRPGRSRPRRGALSDERGRLAAPPSGRGAAQRLRDERAGGVRPRAPTRGPTPSTPPRLGLPWASCDHHGPDPREEEWEVGSL